MSEGTVDLGVVGISDADLANIASFDDALALVNANFGGEILEADKVLGTGFGIADEKAAYVGVPMLILKASRFVGDQGNFWSLHVVCKDGRKVIINDGGSGIAAQMDALVDNHPDFGIETTGADGKTRRHYTGKPILVKNGLRVSRYVHPEHGPSVTYYLDTSASA